MKRLIAFVLALFVASLGFASAAQAASTLYVDDNNCPGPGTGTRGNPFCTINAAIAAAANGDTIKVRAGTYEEMVNINKSVRLLGAQAGVTALTGRTNTKKESVVLAADPNVGSDGPIQLNANNVTVDGFTARDAYTGGGFGSNVWTSPSFSGYRIANNIIRGGTIGISLNTIEAGSLSQVVRNRIANNSEPGSSSGSGIYSDINMDNVSISKNVFVGNNNVAVGINGANNSGVTISRNTMDSPIYLQNTAAVIARNRLRNSNTHAIQLFDNNDNTVIKLNEITRPEWSGIRFTTGNANVTVSDNTISGVGIDGIHLGASTTGSKFTDNTVIGSTGRGVLVDFGASGNTFRDNTVKGSARGPDIEDNSVGAGTAGTANTYINNDCQTSDPAAICN